MGRLTTQQLEALASGQPVRQSWSIIARTGTSTYYTTLIDSGIFPDPTGAKRTVINPGKRTIKVWNPHPMEVARPEAVRYAIDVDTSSGIFFAGVGSVWNPLGFYEASPPECFLKHQVFVYIPSADTWSEIADMAFIGRIISVEYTGGAGINRADTGGGVTLPAVASQMATITSEQEGAWKSLRRVFTKDDADVAKLPTAAIPIAPM